MASSPPSREKIRGLVLIGEAAERIESELGPHVPTFPEASLEAAVERAFRLAKDRRYGALLPHVLELRHVRELQGAGRRIQTDGGGAVKKGLVIAASSLFFYGLLRDMTLLKTLMLCAAIASSFAISKVPVKYLAGAKYPVIGLSLILPFVLIIYPWTRHHQAIDRGNGWFLPFTASLFFSLLSMRKTRRCTRSDRCLPALRGVLHESLSHRPFRADPAPLHLGAALSFHRQ